MGTRPTAQGSPMALDKSAFMLIVGSLAAGGAGGYYYHAKSASEVRPDGASATTAPATSAGGPSTAGTSPAGATANAAAASATASATASASALAASSAPACDDTVGTPAECPSGAPGSADEGICGGNGSIAIKRCRDYKASFKPRVAELAVACLRKLTGEQLCDPTRANLCGHEALMLACHESPPLAQSALTSANLAAAPTDPLAAPRSPVAAQCATILKGCATAVPPVSLADCLRTLSGMTESGRAGMVACMKTGCELKGLLGCEGLPPPP